MPGSMRQSPSAKAAGEDPPQIIENLMARD
jgi:hypothetical protein